MAELRPPQGHGCSLVQPAELWLPVLLAVCLLALCYAFILGFY
jgi:hypothetical protein